MTILGFRITVHPTFLLGFLLISFSLYQFYLPTHWPAPLPSPVPLTLISLGTTSTLFLSVLLHELAHALTAERLGARIDRITLHVLGGAAHMSREISTPTHDILVALAGPLFSLILSVLCSLDRTHFIMGYLARINFLLFLVNLWPGFPLDGSRLLRAYFWHTTGSFAIAMERTLSLSRYTAIPLVVLGVGGIFTGHGTLLIFLIGLLILLSTHDLYPRYRNTRALNGPVTHYLIPLQHLPRLTPDSSPDTIVHAFHQYGFAILPLQQH